MCALPVGVQYILHQMFPCFPVFGDASYLLNPFLAPFCDIIEPFPPWSALPVRPLHHSKHHRLYHTPVIHSANVTKQVEFPFHDGLHNNLLSSCSSSDFFISYFLLPPYVKYSSVASHFECPSSSRSTSRTHTEEH